MKRPIFILLLLLCAASVEATTYWVATTGSDSTACSAVDGTTDPGTYKLSIFGATGGTSCLTQPGDRVIVKNGSYSGSNNQCTSYTNGACPLVAGVSGNPIVIEAQNVGGATIASPLGIFHPRYNWITFRGFALAVVRPPTASGGGHVLSAAHNEGRTGILFEDLSLTVDDQRTTPPSSTQTVSGIVFGGGSQITVRRVTGTSPPGAVRSVGSWGYTQGGTDLLIEDSHFSSDYDSNAGCWQFHKNGGTPTTHQRVIFRRNTLYDCGGHGLFINYTTDAQVYENVIYSTVLRGIWASANCQKCAIWNNTINETGDDGILISNGVTGVLRNNIILEATTAIDNQTPAASLAASNNRTSGTPSVEWVDPDDPTHVDRDFHLLSGASSVGAGTANICTSTDVSAGRCNTVLTRTNCLPDATACDQGAYEFGGVAGPLVGQYLLNNSAADTSGQGNTGTNSGGTFDATNKVEGSHAWLGDTNTDYISIPTIGWSLKFSISAWLRNTGLPTGGNYQYILAHQIVSPASERIFLNVKAGGLLNIRFGSGEEVSGVATLTANTWYHVAVVRNGAQAIIYVNGVEVAQTTVAGLAQIQPTARIGNSPQYTTSGWVGQIDAFEIWNTARTAAEILATCQEGTRAEDAGVTCGAAAPTYAAVNLASCANDAATGLVQTCTTVSTPIDPAYCLTASNYSATYNTVNAAISGCSVVNGASSTITFNMLSAPASGAVVITLTNTLLGGDTVTATNNFSPVVTAGDDLSQLAYWWRDSNINSSAIYEGSPTVRARAPRNGHKSLRALIFNSAGAGAPEQPYTLYCSRDNPSGGDIAATRVSTDCATLGICYDTNIPAQGIPDKTLTLASLTTRLGGTFQSGGVWARSDPSNIQLLISAGQQVEYEFILKVGSDPVDGTLFSCGVRTQTGVVLELGTLAELEVTSPRHINY